MIEIAQGNVLEADAEALVNTVNCVGVMGKGIALQFRRAFPDNYREYADACRHGLVIPGHVLVHKTGRIHNPKYIINFPTKRHWRGKSRMEDIEKGLVSLSDEIRTRGIISVAIPPLGSGLGGLVWNDVKKRIVQALTPLTKVHVFLYEPTGSPEPEAMPVGTERPELTLSRALLVSLMAMYKELAYNLSLLEIQKLAYFLQEAGENLKLRYKRFAHGPYAANLNYVLDKLEGHYIRGYGDNQNPMTPIRVLDGAVEEASEFLEHEPEARDRLKRVASVIEGFQTPYGMELLASVHWLAAKETSPATTSSEAYARLIEWKSNARKTYKLSHVEVAWKQLSDTNFLTSKTARH